MGAHVAELSATAQHPGRLGESGLGVIQVGVAQYRDDRVEGVVSERQGGGIGHGQDGGGWTGPLSGHA